MRATGLRGGPSSGATGTPGWLCSAVLR